MDTVTIVYKIHQHLYPEICLYEKTIIITVEAKSKWFLFISNFSPQRYVDMKYVVCKQ